MTTSDLENKEYADPSRFKTMYRRILDDRENMNARLLNFVSGCRVIYEESENLATKIAIPFLLERVTEKYRVMLKQLKRIKEEKDQEWHREVNELRYPQENIENDPIFKMFMGINDNTPMPNLFDSGSRDKERNKTSPSSENKD